MESHNRHSTGTERRESTRLSMQQQDDEDDYDLAVIGISDGFRPSGMGGMEGMGMSENQSPRQYTPLGRKTPPLRPSSITKPRGSDSFALRHDGGMSPLRRNSQITSAANPALTRSSSFSTEMNYIRPESPYRGPSGPSHPYQMYPQESRLARTASVATASTVQVTDRPYHGPGSPTHPYGMYPQNTVPEAEVLDNSIPAVPVPPVGFPGSNNNYQRRLGPDGEEIADLIGPDGHTEQLPPYTQYPEEAFVRKTRPHVTVPLAGAGGIGLATRNPEFASMEDLTTPQSRMSTRSSSSDASNHQVNIAAIGASEKPELKKWQQVARRQVCNIIPIWVLVLVAVVFILFGIILGTVLAILKPRHIKPKHHYPSSGDGDVQTIIVTTMTTTFDASLLTTSPTSLPTLATGTYALPISVPSTIQNSCLSNTAQSSAWSCNVPMSSYTIVITPIPGASNLHNNEIDLNLGNSTFGGYYPYGTQPPVLTKTQVLNLVTDSQDPSRGPSWFFELPYNKLVILPENALSAPGSQKRDLSERDFQVSEFMKKQVAQPGDMPWFCYWNGTLLEVFIYVNLTSSAGSHTTSSSLSATTMKTGAYSAATSSPSSLYEPVWLPAYPKVIKIEERRVPGDQSIAPYCVQQNIDAYGNATPLLNSTSQPVTAYLNETEASSISQISGKRSYEVSLQERNLELSERQSSGSCGCVWLWT